MSEQEQYSRTDCIELVGLPNNIDGKVQENAVLKTFQLVEINIGRQNIHAVHRLADQQVVIVKITNRHEKKEITNIKC